MSKNYAAEWIARVRQELKTTVDANSDISKVREDLEKRHPEDKGRGFEYVHGYAALKYTAESVLRQLELSHGDYLMNLLERGHQANELLGAWGAGFDSDNEPLFKEFQEAAGSDNRLASKFSEFISEQFEEWAADRADRINENASEAIAIGNWVEDEEEEDHWSRGEERLVVVKWAGKHGPRWNKIWQDGEYHLGDNQIRSLKDLADSLKDSKQEVL